MHSTLKPLTQAALLCALLIILGLIPGIPLGVIPVAIVLQNLGVMLAGELLPPRFATLAVGSFLLLVALGLPLLSGGRGGLAVLLGPSGGYLLAWLFTPALNAWSQRLLGTSRGWWQEFLVAAFCLALVVDFCGALWLTLVTQTPLAASLLGSAVFLPGDLAKVGLAVLVARRLRESGRVVHA